MKLIIPSMTFLYSKLLLFYPGRFQVEFADEMQVVFMDSLDDASREGTLSFLFVCLKEFGGLPFHILSEFWHEIKRKESGMVNDHPVTETGVGAGKNRWDALIGALPFVLFGIASILSRTQYPFNAYSYLAFYVVILLGFLIGMIKGFPRWAYSYLGWSLVFAWWWTDMGTYGLRIFGVRIYHWTWQIWVPLLATLGITLLWTRSLHPLRKLVRGIWQDWTLLSLAIYAFVVFVALLYDENHHPDLFAFIAATTLTVWLAVWTFLKSASGWKRVMSLLAGFVTALMLNNISYATQNYAGYYNLPPSPPPPWYTVFDGIIIWTVIYSGIMYWPALIGLVRHIINNRQKPAMPA